jgi:hypothetical protein
MNSSEFIVLSVLSGDFIVLKPLSSSSMLNESVGIHRPQRPCRRFHRPQAAFIVLSVRSVQRVRGG